MGHRRRRLPGRQLPAAVVGVERQVPRLRARLLARHRSDAGGVRLALHRQLRSLRGHGAPPLREHQLHHRARRLHAARSRVLQRQAQRGQRRRQPRRRETTTARGTAAPKARPTTPTIIALRAPPDAQLPGDAAAVAGRADALRRRRDRPHASRATTTPTARTTRSRGTTGSTADTALLKFTPRPDPAAQRASGLPPAPLVPGAADPRQRGQRHRLVHARRHRDVGRGLAGRLRQVARRLPERQRHPRRPTSAGGTSWTTAST